MTTARIHTSEGTLVIFTREKQQEELRYFIHSKDKSDIGCVYHHATHQYMKFNPEEMKEQMKIWKNQRVDGTLTINPKNHRSPMIQGKQFYTLVIQDPDLSRNPQMDPMGLAFDDGSFLVSGYIYIFTREANRDNVYKYVMGL